MVQGIGGPRGPVQPMSGLPEIQELRSKVEVLNTTLRGSEKTNWEDAATHLDGIRDSLAGIKTANNLHEMGGQDLQSILDVAEFALGKAEKQKEAAGEWSIMERILQILGYLAFVIPGMRYTESKEKEKAAAVEEADKPVQLLLERVEKLRARIDPEKTRLQYFEMRESPIPLNDPDRIELTGGRGQMTEGISRHLLGQQEILRDPQTGRVGGAISPDRLNLKGPDGKPLSASEKANAMSSFEAVGDELHVSEDILANDSISANERDDIASDLVRAAKSGATVELKNKDGLHGADVTLRNEGGELVETIERETAASRTGLQYYRGGEIIPGTGSDQTFQDVISAMNELGPNSWGYDDKFKELNGVLHQGFVADRESHNISPTMSFQQYKLQFAQFPLDAIAKDQLWWHDGEGDLTAPELAFLQLRVNDLPDSHIPYKVSFSYKTGDPDRVVKINLPLKKRMDPKSTEFREALEQHLIEKFNIAPDQQHLYRDSTKIISGRAGREFTGQDTLLPAVTDLSDVQIRMVLADSGGDVRNSDGSVMDVADNFDAAKDLALQVLKRNVMTSAFTDAAHRSAESISDLLSGGVPDTQKLFLRQSNGAANADFIEVDSGPFDTRVHPLGLAEVISSGQDVGAFGKCAPTSYFCGAMCGVGRSGRDGIDVVKAHPDKEIAALGVKIESLLTTSPMTQASQQKLTKAINDLRTQIRTKATAVDQASLATAHEAIEQVKTSIVDRMVVKVDDEGPYFEMNFFLPPLGPGGDGYISGNELTEYSKHAGPMTVKVRPEDVQEYLEWTNRVDEYRDNKLHMMDFFKDPRSLNTAELLGAMGVGLIAVGVDKALKNAGKSSGLLFGPSPKVVGPMVYNRATEVDTFNFDSSSNAFQGLKGKLEKESISPKFKADMMNALTGLSVLQASKDIDDTTRPLFMEKVDGIRKVRDEVRAEVFKEVRASNNDTAKSYVDFIDNQFQMGMKDYGSSDLRDMAIPTLKQIISGDPDLKKLDKHMSWFDTDWNLWAMESRINEKDVDVTGKRDNLLQSFRQVRDDGGSIAFTMGYDPKNYHVNYLQAWGTPTVGGVDIDALDLSRCHMNHKEIGAMASAWKNDRAVPLSFTMNAAKIAEGFEGIAAKLKAQNGDGSLDGLIAECEKFVSRAEDVQEVRDEVVYKSQREPYQAKLRDLEADTMDWFHNNLVIKNAEQDGLKPENVVMMLSNTERDNRVHDDASDRDRVARGNIGDQLRGTSNALDATYFVPLNKMASGFDNFDPGKAKRYANAETDDSFALLTSMEVMRPYGNFEVALR